MRLPQSADTSLGVNASALSHLTRCVHITSLVDADGTSSMSGKIGIPSIGEKVQTHCSDVDKS